MKKKAYISGILILIIAALVTVGLYFGVAAYEAMGYRVYGLDLFHILIIVSIFYLISCIMIEYLYQVCVRGTYDSEVIVRKKMRTFIVIAVLMNMMLTYYILTLASQVIAPGNTEDGIVRLIVTLLMGCISILSLFFAYLIILKNVKIPVLNRMSDGALGPGRIFDDIGRKIIAQNKKPKTPEQVVSIYLRHVINAISVLLILWACVGNSIAYKGSVMGYLSSGQWERGFNVFAFTACIFAMCIAFTISSILRYISEAVIITFDSRGETIGRMITSLLKYIILIMALFVCLSLLGFNAGTLVASAGVVSVVVGLGAKELIGDILAGLFIIIEGEFRVGDIITVGDFRGTVSEIGVRTTKMVDGVGNVKIINNSQITDVINMTKNHSFANCNVGIGYDEDLEHVEEVLAKELPLIRDRNRLIKGGPFYRGVASLADSSVILRIMAECDEEDRIQLERDLNREIKLIFDKNCINIPYPQIVVNEGVKRTVNMTENGKNE
ncbi:MAG: mechanosensitive ion channel family protein [Lachnospiraceae bacterium]|nr:mechanosensitive ion channel family protein [Lachnospiraceae bacterium]